MRKGLSSARHAHVRKALGQGQKTGSKRLRVLYQGGTKPNRVSGVVNTNVPNRIMAVKPGKCEMEILDVVLVVGFFFRDGAHL